MNDLKTEFEKAKAGFASATTSLPKDYLDENAERLLLIAEELRKSFGVELKLVRMVSDLDVGDPKVREMADELKWYVDEKFFENERTHCHNIARIRARMVRRFVTGSSDDERRIAAFEQLVAPLNDADNDILDSLEQLAKDARDATAAIEAAVGPPERNLARAEELKREFVRKAQERLATARKGLRELSRLSEQLIDIASGLTPVR
jgi:hypothetical protein